MTSLLVRLILTGVALWFVYHETGPVTTLAIGLIAVSHEITFYLMIRAIAASDDIQAAARALTQLLRQQEAP